MSIIWADFPSGSQGLYGDDESKMLDAIWAGINGSLEPDPDPNITGKVLKIEGNTAARFILPAPTNTAGVAFRYWNGNLGRLGGHALCTFTDVIGEAQCSITVDVNGYIRAYRGDNVPFTGGVELGATTVPVITTGAWKHIEAKFFTSNTVGTIEVRVEGQTVLSITGVDNVLSSTDTKMYAWRTLSIAGVSSPTYYIKDLVFWDGSGTVNNDFIGTCGVYWRPVASDVSSGWTPSSGTSDYALLDETPAVDTDYISADTTPPAPSIMGFDSLPANIVSIRALIPVQRGQKSDSGDASVQMGLSPNGTDWTSGTAFNVSTSFTYYKDVSELSPDTSAAWTPAEFDTLNLRINRIT